MRTTLLVCATMLMLILAGCSKSPEEASVDTLDEISDVLDGIKTKEDAQKVKGRLGDLFAELEGYGKKFGDKDPDPAMATEFAKKFYEVFGKMGRLPPEAVDVLKDEFKKFRK